MTTSLQDKTFSISGYAVNARGYTRGVHIEVSAPDTDQAKSLAAARLRWDGLTHFRPLTVREITIAPDRLQ
ncbi:hypothetical protein [Rahnella sp. ChDrAdgB13]|uniref:hypothetical protein n=1 Tax=Rahnella sp. ChDrAdgB13 TaxID=1850581 RepID=UPI001AD871AD|nr:hypothetical protein [Rahnella sp. ChDrAdgB13]